LLPPAEQRELRGEFGELLLLMARSELLRAAKDDPAAVESALRWNKLAETCFATDQRPRWLASQRAELLARQPGAADPLPADLHSELDPYHDGLQEAVRGHFSEALAKLVSFSNRHPDHFMAWYVRGVSHDGVGQLADAAAAFTVCAALR